MTRTMNTMGRPLAVMIVAVSLVACSTGVKESARKTIATVPSGATVYASGKELGQTPLKVVPDEAFPPRWTNFKYRRAGKLTIKKPGCETYSLNVDDSVLREDMHVELNCDPNYQPPAKPATAPTPQQHSQPAAPQGRSTESAETRLRRLESLHDKGLISDEEYRSIRQEILDQL